MRSYLKKKRSDGLKQHGTYYVVVIHVEFTDH